MPFSYPKAYLEYLVYFQGERDLFECHEVMEEYWKQEKDPQWLALIQLSVSLYHHRQENFRGASRLLEKVIDMVENDRKRYEKLGIRVAPFVKQLYDRQKAINNLHPYTSFNIPLADATLEEECKKRCMEQGLSWCAMENAHNRDEYLIYKHRKRDRSEVVLARQESLLNKRKEREAD
ncbi:DUF309 domain-containing protein [Alteribacter populi]|uniref:DUF309 domain-containing protein n=1 Tax=Alteribacter populi TaxID=2011011 RepID=UPI000BBB5A5D|nr:DUF309 domain-containing protein [Alteribacter populi]